MSILIKGREMPNNCGECLVDYDGTCRLHNYDDTEYYKRLDDCPLVAFDTDDVLPVIHGHWKNVKRVLNTKWGECSNCDRANELTRYCPYCGAKMESEGTDNE